MKYSLVIVALLVLTVDAVTLDSMKHHHSMPEKTAEQLKKEDEVVLRAAVEKAVEADKIRHEADLEKKALERQLKYEEDHKALWDGWARTAAINEETKKEIAAEAAAKAAVVKARVAAYGLTYAQIKDNVVIKNPIQLKAEENTAIAATVSAAKAAAEAA